MTLRGVLALVTQMYFLICALTVVILECESLVTLEQIRICTLDRTFWGILTLVTQTDFPIRALTVMTLEYESLVTPERVRVCALDRTLKRHSYPGNPDGFSYLCLDSRDFGI
jgi:hypothetical protein